MQGNDHLEFGNNQNGIIIPPHTDTLSIKSLYKNTLPEFWDYSYVWPGIGTNYFFNYNAIPSYINYQNGIHGFCFNEKDTLNKNFEICPSEKFYFTNRSYNQAGNYVDSLVDFKNEKFLIKVSISLPPFPELRYEHDTLKTTSMGIYYNWYKNNEWLIGTTSPHLEYIKAGTYYVEVTDSNFCILRSDSLVVSPYGVLKNRTSNEINIFPNPLIYEIYIEQKKIFTPK